MLFKSYFNSIADILEAKLKGYSIKNINPADKGELCELFMKDFLIDALGDNFKIFRGGKIINAQGSHSSQLDIILCSKRTIKIFSDKGLYPTETVKGVFSITSTLDKQKLIQCMNEFISIPKTGYHFTAEKFYPEDFKIKSQQIFENLIPFTCIFAFNGNISNKWLEDISDWIKEFTPPISLTPDLIIVNKKAIIIKNVNKSGINKLNYDYSYYDLSPDDQGEPFSHILFDLYNLSHEELYLQPNYSPYFES